MVQLFGSLLVFASLSEQQRELDAGSSVVRLEADGATVLLFAPASPEATLAISPHHLLFSEITVTSTYSCSPQETRQALKLIEGGRISVEELITHRFDLTGVGEAIRLAAQAGESLKIVIMP